MESHYYWFLLAAALLALEMATGTFYMLVLGVAVAIGGLAAWSGLELTWQLSLSALAGITGTLILQRRKKAETTATHDLNPNLGEQVRVLAWGDGGKLRVHYRGTEWDAELAAADMPRDTPLYIQAMRGSTLILTQQKP
jgi:membrane protein implicated in regulation of membrane protease activity